MTAPVVVRSRGTFRTEVEAGSHRFVLDEPVSAGGTDLGPTPYDVMAAGLGACTAMTLHFYAKREKIPLEGVDVNLTHDREHAKDCADCDTRDGYIHRFKLQIAVHGNLTGEQRSKLLDVASRCPVAKMLRSEIRIDHELSGG